MQGFLQPIDLNKVAIIGYHSGHVPGWKRQVNLRTAKHQKVPQFLEEGLVA